ncbi:MAG TPA: hypothetical protein VEX39_12850 [Thermoleophilaceae bacterium]|nr:hypothetical protein [Thermoleophilaceae bacterium]
MGAGARHHGLALAGAWVLVAAGLAAGSQTQDHEGRDSLAVLLVNDGIVLLAFIALIVISARAARVADVPARGWWVAVGLGGFMMALSVSWDLTNELLDHESTDYALGFLLGLLPAVVGSVALLVRATRNVV